MKDINLRPAEYALRKEFYWPRVLKTIGAILYFLILVGSGYYLYIAEQNRAVVLNSLKMEYLFVSQQLNQLKRVNEELVPLKAKRDFTRGLVESKHYWSDYLQKLNQAVPPDVVIDSINAQGTDMISISGRSSTAESAVVFADLINELSVFDQARYQYISFSGEDFFYQISCKLDNGYRDQER